MSQLYTAVDSDGARGTPARFDQGGQGGPLRVGQVHAIFFARHARAPFTMAESIPERQMAINYPVVLYYSNPTSFVQMYSSIDYTLSLLF